MKKIRIAIVALLAVSAMLVSCKKDNGNQNLVEAIVTVKTATTGECYLQLDENTTLKPTNWTKSPFDSQTRCHLIYNDLGKSDDTKYDKKVDIYSYSKILTKTPVTTKGTVEEDKVAYGNDGIGICYNWATNIEDGYLTLNFAGIWGNTGITHYLNLVTGTNPDDPYKVVLRHNKNGDGSTRTVYGLVAFDLKDLPDTQGETVKLTLTYTYFDGTEHSYVFPYCTGKTSSSSNEVNIQSLDNPDVS